MAYKQFELLNAGKIFTPVLKQILEFIETELPADTKAEKLLFKSKFILTELLTNSLKHSSSDHSLIDIKIENDNLTITKIDTGTPLKLLAKTNAVTNKVVITHDALHTLYAKSIAKNQVQFICDDNANTDFTIDNIIEHFGLLIITKAAYQFNYKYAKTTNSNAFEVLLKLN